MRKNTSRTRFFVMAALSATVAAASLSACSDSTPDAAPMASEDTMASEAYADTAMAYDSTMTADGMSTMTGTGMGGTGAGASTSTGMGSPTQ